MLSTDFYVKYLRTSGLIFTIKFLLVYIRELMDT